MSDILVWGTILIIPVVVIITYILVQRFRIKMTVEKGLHEEKKAPITIIEAGSNFTTRMSDFKKNINRLNDVLDRRNELMSEFQENAKSETEDNPEGG